MYTTKITKVGNSSAVIIPKEIMDRLNLRQGDQLNIEQSSEGIQLNIYDEDKMDQLEMARKIMRENRNMLKKLAQ